jgi:hypothetical protein
MKLSVLFLTILYLLSPFLSIQVRCQVNIDTNSSHFNGAIDDKWFGLPEKILNKSNSNNKQTQLSKIPIKPEIFDAKEVIVSDDQSPESEFHAVMNPLDSNVIIVSPMKQANDYEFPIQCPIYYTHNFGKTWNTSTFQSQHRVRSGRPAGGGDPMFAFNTDGKAYFSWISLVIGFDYSSNPDSVHEIMYWASSTDNGVTWQRENNDKLAHWENKINFNQYMFGLKFMHDKEWMACDRSNSIFRNNIYTSLTLFKIDSNKQSSKIVLYKKPATKSIFNNDSVIVSSRNYDHTQYSSIDVDNNGNVHVCFWGEKDSTQSLWHAISTDGGNSFQAETKISDLIFMRTKNVPNSENDTIAGITKRRFIPSPQFAIDKSDKQCSGYLYEVWTAEGVNKNEGNGYDIYLSRSTDNGETWSPAKIINNDTKGIKCSQFYPSIAINKNGVIVLGWYDRRDDTQDQFTDYYIGISVDAGETFSNIKVTNEATDFTTIFKMSPTFFGIGEYTQLLATNGYAIPIWTDGRNFDGNLDIYAAFVPIDKPTSVERIEQINSTISFSDPIPNPATNEVIIKLNFPKPVYSDLVLTDLNGKIIKTIISKQFEIGDENISFHVSDLSSGEYYLVLSSELGYLMRKLIVLK